MFRPFQIKESETRMSGGAMGRPTKRQRRGGSEIQETHGRESKRTRRKGKEIG